MARHHLPLFFLLLASGGVRLLGLGRLGLWTDEFHTLAVSSDPSALAPFKVDIHPPLYYVLMWFWSRLSVPTDFWLRLPSVILGVLLVYLVYRLGLELFAGRGAALFAAMVSALAPMEVTFSQEAKAYVLMSLLQLWAVLLLHRAWRTGSRRAMLKGSMLLAGAFYAHFFAVYGGVAAGLFLLLMRRKGRLSLLRMLEGGGLVVALTLPWVLWRMSGYSSYLTVKMARSIEARQIISMVTETFSLTTVAGYLMLPLAAVGGAALLAGRDVGFRRLPVGGGRDHGATALLLGLTMVVPPLLSSLAANGLGFSLTGFARYFVPSAVVCSMLAGLGLWSLPSGVLRVFVSLLLALALGWGLGTHHSWDYKPAYPRVARYLDGRLGPGDVVLVMRKDHAYELLRRYSSPRVGRRLLALTFGRKWESAPGKKLPATALKHAATQLRAHRDLLLRARKIYYIHHDNWEWSNAERAFRFALQRIFSGMVLQQIPRRFEARHRNGFDSHDLILKRFVRM